MGQERLWRGQELLSEPKALSRPCWLRVAVCPDGAPRSTHAPAPRQPPAHENTRCPCHRVSPLLLLSEAAGQKQFRAQADPGLTLRMEAVQAARSLVAIPTRRPLQPPHPKTTDRLHFRQIPQSRETQGPLCCSVQG